MYARINKSNQIKSLPSPPGVNWEHNDKMRSYGLERSQLGSQ